MTFSILARDPDTGQIGGAAATGSLCVGGWVLRGDARAGISASQGRAPSTLWGEDVLTAMRSGLDATAAVAAVTAADNGRAQRQLSALGPDGRGAAFTGAENVPAMGSRLFGGGVAAGNMLADEAVLDALVTGFDAAAVPFASRLLEALRAAEAAGSDMRGLQSAALLIVAPNMAPLTLRVDASDAPLDDLARLLQRATTGDYNAWRLQVPTLSDPERVLG